MDGPLPKIKTFLFMSKSLNFALFLRNLKVSENKYKKKKFNIFK